MGGDAITTDSAINSFWARLTVLHLGADAAAVGVINAASDVEHVTIYSRGARVRRLTSTGIDGTEIRISGLPLGLSDDTVRAEVIGAGVVTGVRVELDAAKSADRANDAFDRELREARARLVAVEAEVARISAALSGLAALAPVARKSRPDGSAVPAWSKSLDARLAVLELRVAREAELRTALDAAHRELRDAREAVVAAQDRAARASSGRGLRVHELCKTVVATVDGLAAGARLAVEYLVIAARWAPTYCARLAGGTAEVELRAVVAQASGEDWRGARLTLSTALPMRFSELPELPMARIGRRQPEPHKKGFRPPPTGVEVLYQDYDRAFGARSQRPSSGFEEITKEMPAPYASAGPAMTTEFAAALDFESDEPTGVDAVRFDDRQRPHHGPPAAPGAANMAPALPPGSRRSQTEAGMPPPPMPQMAPAPMQAQAKSRGLVGVGALAAAPLGAVAALGGVVAKAIAGKREQTMRYRGAPPNDDGSGGYGGDHDDNAWVADLELDVLGDDAAALLAYGELRMMAAGDVRRGRLVRVGAFVQYSEALAARGLGAVSESELLDAVGVRAAAIEGLIMPPGTSAAWDHVYDHAFVGDAPVDVASDGTWHAISVTAKSAPVAVRHVVVPREGTEVYRIAELVNPLGAPLLPGPIDVFDDGVYLLTSRVDGVPAGGKVELGLGVDPKVKASRNTDYREEASGMLRGKLQLEHEVAIEIANHAARAVDVEVRERLPVVPDGDDDIEVTVTKTEPRWERWDPPPAGPGAMRLKGGHRWRLTIPPGETKKLRAEYAIKIASKHELVGGNRRES